MAVNLSDRTVSTSDPIALQAGQDLGAGRHHPVRSQGPGRQHHHRICDGSKKVDLLDTAGGVSRTYTTQTDGSREMTTYHITGKDYATEHSITNAAGKYVLIERFSTDGTLQYKQSTDPPAC